MGTTRSRSAGPEGQQQQEESLWKPGFRKMVEQLPHNWLPQPVSLVRQTPTKSKALCEEEDEAQPPSGGPHEQASLLWAPGRLLRGWPHSWALILRNNGVGMQGACVAAASLLGEATPGLGAMRLM